MKWPSFGSIIDMYKVNNHNHPASHEGEAGLLMSNPAISKENMRDLLYKNLTSADRKRRVIASSEITDKEGVHSVVRRHFSCMIKQVEKSDVVKPAPYLYVLKERNTREKREHFFCKIKGSLLATNKNKIFLVVFIHTLSIQLTANEKLSEQIG